MTLLQSPYACPQTKRVAAKVCEEAKNGRRVDMHKLLNDPQELLPALKLALKVVKEEKRQAVLNVICGSH